MKLALGIEYAGSRYYGWQRQVGVPTVQQTLEHALSAIANEAITVVCAGRTDKGVHATQQVVHFETTAERTLHAWHLGTNSKLPKDMVINWVQAMADDFHARFSVAKRTYQYLIVNSRVRPAILSERVTWERRPLALENMQQAAAHLIGEQDFTSYRAASCQAQSPIRTIYSLTINRFDDWLLITVCANAFLQHMVRNIVGVLLDIGCGKQASDWTKTVLLAKDRHAAGISAPPAGLYLTAIQYPERFRIPRGKMLLAQFQQMRIP